jgi:probable selenium-dependent hydroxylase accessory protein YqeC
VSITEALQLRGSSVADALGLPESGVLALVGAGGKTTLMYRLARELAGRGCRVVCTTTTRVFEPDPGSVSRVVVQEDENVALAACRSSLSRSGWMLVARHRVAGGKLAGFSSDWPGEVLRRDIADWVLVEADGARKLPLKAPGPKEPVIPVASTHVLAVIGLCCLGTPLDEDHVCRSDMYARITGLPLLAPISTGSLAAVIEHDQGLFKGGPKGSVRQVWLNQTDMPGLRELGRRVASRGLKNVERVVLGAAGLADADPEVWRG